MTKAKPYPVLLDPSRSEREGNLAEKLETLPRGQRQDFLRKLALVGAELERSNPTLFNMLAGFMLTTEHSGSGFKIVSEVVSIYQKAEVEFETNFKKPAVQPKQETKPELAPEPVRKQRARHSHLS